MATKIGKAGKTKAKSAKKGAKKTAAKMTKRTYKKRPPATSTAPTTTGFSTVTGEDYDVNSGNYDYNNFS